MKKNHILFKALSVLIFLVGFSTQLSAQNYALKMSTADQAVLFDATDLNIVMHKAIFPHLSTDLTQNLRLKPGKETMPGSTKSVFLKKGPATSNLIILHR